MCAGLGEYVYENTLYACRYFLGFKMNVNTLFWPAYFGLLPLTEVPTKSIGFLSMKYSITVVIMSQFNSFSASGTEPCHFCTLNQLQIFMIYNISVAVNVLIQTKNTGCVSNPKNASNNFVYIRVFMELI